MRGTAPVRVHGVLCDKCGSEHLTFANIAMFTVQVEGKPLGCPGEKATF